MEENKNEFVENLQDSVDVEVLKEQLATLEADVIKDPKQIEALKKKISKLEKEELKKKTEQEKVTESKDSVKGKSIAQLEQEAEEKKKQDEETKENKEPDKEDTSTEKGYLDAMQKLHDYRVKMYQRMNHAHELSSTQKEFEEEMRLEKEVIALEAKYKAELGDDKDALKSKKEKLAQSERESKKPIQEEIRRRSREYAEAVLGLYRVNEEIEYIHKLYRQDKISEKDYQKRMELAGDEQKKIK